MFLSRYKIFKHLIIYEINPDTGDILNKFSQPKDWEWDPNREKAHWECYRGKVIFVFQYQGKLVFQERSNRFELDHSYRCKIIPIKWIWKQFQLFKDGTCVYKIVYRDPQTKVCSFIRSLFMDDDWWNWDTPFDDVKNYLDNL